MPLVMPRLPPSTQSHGTIVCLPRETHVASRYLNPQHFDTITFTELRQLFLDNPKQYRVQHSGPTCRIWLNTSPRSGSWEKVVLESSNWSSPGEMDRYVTPRTERSCVDLCDSTPLKLRRLDHVRNACHPFVAVRRQAFQVNIEYDRSGAVSRERNRIAQDFGTPERRWLSRHGL